MMFSARGFFSSNGVKERDKIHCSSGEMPGSAGVGQNNSFTGQPHPLPGALSVQYERGEFSLDGAGQSLLISYDRLAETFTGGVWGGPYIETLRWDAPSTRNRVICCPGRTGITKHFLSPAAMIDVSIPI